MEVENKDVYLEFDVIADVEDNLADEIIAKKLNKSVTDKVRKWISEEKITGINIY